VAAESKKVHGSSTTTGSGGGCHWFGEAAGNRFDGVKAIAGASFKRLSSKNLESASRYRKQRASKLQPAKALFISSLSIHHKTYFAKR